MDSLCQSIRQDPQAPLPPSAMMNQSTAGRLSDGKKVTFACFFLFSKLNLTLVALSYLISEYRASVDMTVAVVVSDPCIHLTRNKGESEKEEGVKIVHFFADDYDWPF